MAVENTVQLFGEIHFEKKPDIVLHPKCTIKAEVVHFAEDSKILQIGTAQANLIVNSKQCISESRHRISVSSSQLSFSTNEPVALNEIYMSLKN